MKKVIIAIIILGMGFYLVTLFSGNKQETQTESVAVQFETVESVEQISTDPIPFDESTESAPEVSLVGAYIDYSSEIVAASIDKEIVLFFKADWCPSCRVLDSDIMANLDQIPADVIILQTDYDTETDLRKKYGVTTQHSFVHIDSEGNMIQRWSGGNRLENVLNQIN